MKKSVWCLTASFLVITAAVMATGGGSCGRVREAASDPTGSSAAGGVEPMPRLRTLLVAENPLRLSDAQLADIEEQVCRYQSGMKKRWAAVETERTRLRALLQSGAPDGKTVGSAGNSLTHMFSGMLAERERFEASIRDLLTREQVKSAGGLFEQLDALVYAHGESGRYTSSGGRERLSRLLLLTREQREALDGIMASDRQACASSRSRVTAPAGKNNHGALNGSRAVPARDQARVEAELVVATEQGIARVSRILSRDQRQRARQASGEIEACVREGLLGSGS